MTKIKLTLTCYACPEQYNAFIGDKQVGYLRLRHGLFTVDCPHVGGAEVLCVKPQGDGIFEIEERDKYLKMAVERIHLYLKSGIISTNYELD